MKDISLNYSAEQKRQLEELSRSYRDFLNSSKTERECIAEAVRLAEANGYRKLREGSVCPGDRVYVTSMDKNVAFFHIGEIPLVQGMQILGSHIDSPRLDIKQRPLYEEGDLAYLDLHYYGGIKKYQWLTIPLAIHGVVVLKSGEKRYVVIGEDADDPILCITDLLPHLSDEQLEKNAARFIDGEAMDLLVGSTALPDEEQEAVRKHIAQLLQMRYGFTEEDFLSAELEVVPAGHAREAGLDRSMIFAYGHDDRVCAYASLAALLKQENVTKTACCLLVDKEEIGSVGATGAQASFFCNALAELMMALGEYSELSMRRCLRQSMMLSSDVTAGFDPLYASVYDKRSAAMMGGGINFNKYLGPRGKGGSNDANPEFVALIRRIMDNAGVRYQMTELGRVDAGGGGTIAGLFARYGMQVIDCGLPVLSMHSPGEIVTKRDLYETWRGYQVFLQNTEEAI